MLDRQRQIIEEKLSQVISRLEKLYTTREEANKRIEEIKNLLSAYSKYGIAKSALKTNSIIYPSIGIITELLICFMSDYIFLPVNNEFYSVDITKWQLTHIVIPLICAGTMLVTSFGPFFDFIRYKGTSKINEEEQNKELASAENLSKNINKQIANLEARKATYSNAINYIDDLPKTISRIFESSNDLTCQGDEIPDIEGILISEFNNFLNEKVDYSKIHLDVVPDIKEYKLKAHK